MKQVYAGNPKGVVLSVLLLTLLTNGISTYYQFNIVPAITKFISVLVILTIFYSKQKAMANVFLFAFVFWFLGDAFHVLDFGGLAQKLSITFYLGSYCLLAFILIGKLRRIKYEGLISLYLILILVLNSYFLYVLYGILKDNFSDKVNLILSICHGIVLLAMAFFAFAVYLSKETTQSINFLVMVCCFVFADVLAYICNLYVYFWVFDFIANMLHLTSLILFYVYVSNHHKIIKVRSGASSREEDYLLDGSERLTV